MDKKPLIVVSFCAVVLLVMASLSNVVGYQSVKSSVNNSPLFATRTERATNQQQNTLTSQYIGMGRGSYLQFPIRDNKIEQLEKVIDVISNMDDMAFTRFTELCLQKIYQDKTLKDITPNEIIKTLQLLRIESETITESYIKANNQFITSPQWPTLCAWLPGCILINILVAIGLIFFLFLIVFFHFTVGCWQSITYPRAAYC